MNAIPTMVAKQQLWKRQRQAKFFFFLCTNFFRIFVNDKNLSSRNLFPNHSKLQKATKILCISQIYINYVFLPLHAKLQMAMHQYEMKRPVTSYLWRRHWYGRSTDLVAALLGEWNSTILFKKYFENNLLKRNHCSERRDVRTQARKHFRCVFHLVWTFINLRWRLWMVWKSQVPLKQWFSNCGTRTTSGTRGLFRWYASSFPVIFEKLY